MATTAGILQYSFLLPVAATIGGWFVVARQTDRREYRKELRDQIKDLRHSIDEVRSKAIDYWLEDDQHKAASAAIGLKAELMRMGRLVRTIASAGLSFEIDNHIRNVRQSATGGDFEKRGRHRDIIADEERVADTVGALEDMLTAIDVAFYTVFAPPRSSRFWRWLPLGGALLLSRD